MTLNEWIVFGHVGMSSKTMWAVVTGTLTPDNIKKFRVEIPYDKDDFSRCYTLWKESKLSDSDLRKIKEICPIWKPFIDNWYDLVRRYENNEKMYKYMSELVEKGRLNAGQIKIDANTWSFRLSIGHNGQGIAEGRNLEVESFNLAQMPNRIIKD